MQLKTMLDELLEENREMFNALDKEARLYSGLMMEKLAGQLDLAYRDELTGIESALERAEQRIAELEKRIAELEAADS